MAKKKAKKRYRRAFAGKAAAAAPLVVRSAAQGRAEALLAEARGESNPDRREMLMAAWSAQMRGVS